MTTTTYQKAAPNDWEQLRRICGASQHKCIVSLSRGEEGGRRSPQAFCAVKRKGA
jgi:hypothetical protein